MRLLLKSLARLRPAMRLRRSALGGTISHSGRSETVPVCVAENKGERALYLCRNARRFSSSGSCGTLDASIRCQERAASVMIPKTWRTQ